MEGSGVSGGGGGEDRRDLICDAPGVVGVSLLVEPVARSITLMRNGG